MSVTRIHPTEKRMLGGYAVHWTQMTDWFRNNLHAIVHTVTYPRTQVRTARPEAEASEEKKLQAVVEDTHNILLQARSVFPLMLFPDVITIDRQKLNIVYKQFFNVEQTVSVPLDNVKNIQADIGPFFGSLTITSDLFINNTQKVKFLRMRDVKEIQKLVQGATTAKSQGIDISKIETNQLKHLLIELGEGHTDLLDK